MTYALQNPFQVENKKSIHVHSTLEQVIGYRNCYHESALLLLIYWGRTDWLGSPTKIASNEPGIPTYLPRTGVKS